MVSVVKSEDSREGGRSEVEWRYEAKAVALSVSKDYIRTEGDEFAIRPRSRERTRTYSCEVRYDSVPQAVLE